MPGHKAILHITMLLTGPVQPVWHLLFMTKSSIIATGTALCEWLDACIETAEYHSYYKIVCETTQRKLNKNEMNLEYHKSSTII